MRGRRERRRRQDVATEKAAAGSDAGCEYGVVAGGRVEDDFAGQGEGFDEAGLEADGLGVDASGGASLDPHVGDVAAHPDPLGTEGRFLEDETVFADAAGAVAHAHPALVPGHEIDDGEGGPGDPGADAGTQMILVDPEYQMAGRHENAIDEEDESADDVLGHLGKQGARLLAGSLVSVTLTVEDAAVLRIEEGEGEGTGRQGGEEVASVAGVGAVEREPGRDAHGG